MLAIMVDLGWPWWVTSLIAAIVVVATGTVALVARRVSVRAVAVVLAIEGVAIAAFAPLVMEDRRTLSSMRAQSLTRAEFARRADGNCAALARKFAAAGDPQTPAEIGRRLDRIMPPLWDALARQGMLVARPADRAAAGRWMNAMTAFAVNFEALGHSANQRNQAGVAAANARLSKSISLSARLSRQLGLKVCFS